MYKYIATEPGTLHPYRYVEAGETINSPTPLNIPWLVPAEKYNPLNEPLMTAMPPAKGAAFNKVLNHPAPADPAYDRAMLSITDLEKQRDELEAKIKAANAAPTIAPATPAPQATPPTTVQPAATGTGNQDVLA